MAQKIAWHVKIDFEGKTFLKHSCFYKNQIDRIPLTYKSKWFIWDSNLFLETQIVKSIKWYYVFYLYIVLYSCLYYISSLLNLLHAWWTSFKILGSSLHSVPFFIQVFLRCTFAFNYIWLKKTFFFLYIILVYVCYAILNEFFLLSNMKTKIFINPLVATKIFISWLRRFVVCLRVNDDFVEAKAVKDAHFSCMIT